MRNRHAQQACATGMRNRRARVRMRTDARADVCRDAFVREIYKQIEAESDGTGPGTVGRSAGPSGDVWTLHGHAQWTRARTCARDVRMDMRMETHMCACMYVDGYGPAEPRDEERYDVDAITI